MATKIVLPKFGQTVETSEITQWMVKEGSAIAKGTILCEIATDKSTLEVESQFAGTLLRIVLAPGTTAPVGCVMAILGDPGEKLSDAFISECLATQVVPAGGEAPTAPPPGAAAVPPNAARTAPALAPAKNPASTPPVIAQPAPRPAVRSAAPAAHGRLFVSPRARRLAERASIPLSILTGSGENGRIVEADIQKYLEAVGTVSPVARAAALKSGLDLRGIPGSGPDGRIMLEDLAHAALAAAPTAAAATSKLKDAPAPLVARLEKNSPMRRAIAANMSQSAATIPAFQLEVTVDAASLIARRERDKAAGIKISYGDLIAKATALTIRHHPQFAATWTDGGISFLDRINIAFAVAIPGGLTVPVVWDCDTKDVPTIAAESVVLVEKARTGKLSPSDYTGAVFTLSNLGSFPVDRFVAIVPPGQSGIIAIGRIRDELVVRNGGFIPAKLLSLTLSADHRYIDGADGAAFMKDLKELLENASSI